MGKFAILTAAVSLTRWELKRITHEQVENSQVLVQSTHTPWWLSDRYHETPMAMAAAGCQCRYNLFTPTTGKLSFEA
jgi:hypothetical protein